MVTYTRSTPFTSWEDLLNGAVGDSGWQIPTLGNSWVSYDGGVDFDVPQYKLRGGIVWLKGQMKSGTAGTTIFTLPAGYRPLKRRDFMVTGFAGAYTAVIRVFGNGNVQLLGYGTGSSNASVSLELSFPAEQ